MKKVAVLGPKGTFSDSALKEYAKNGKELSACYYSTINEVFRHIGKDCDIGIIPIENTLDGYVQRSLDMLMELNLLITSEVTIPIDFSLVANVKNIEDIKRLYVQFKTHGQCMAVIDNLDDVEIITTSSNMESYNLVKNGVYGDSAIIPRHMYYDADFTIETVTDSENNYTRFLVLEPNTIKNILSKDENIKVALFVIPNIDRAGILYEILDEFNKKNINLCSIMSRPTKQNMGTYNFYIELSGKYEEKDCILETLENLKNKYNLKILGIYSM